MVEVVVLYVLVIFATCSTVAAFCPFVSAPSTFRKRVLALYLQGGSIALFLTGLNLWSGKSAGEYYINLIWGFGGIVITHHFLVLVGIETLFTAKKYSFAVKTMRKRVIVTIWQWCLFILSIVFWTFIAVCGITMISKTAWPTMLLLFSIVSAALRLRLLQKKPYAVFLLMRVSEQLGF